MQLIKKDEITYSDDFKVAVHYERQIEEINLLDTVEKIEPNAFKYCIAKSIHFPKALKKIGQSAFYNSCIENVYIDNNIDLDVFAFSTCMELKKVSINTPVIPNGCFWNSNGKYIEFEFFNTEKISKNAFANTRIYSLNLPDTLKYIGEEAFLNATFGCDTLFLPEGLIALGYDVFKDTNIEHIYLPKSLENPGNLLLNVNKNKYTIHAYQEILDKFTYPESKKIVPMTLVELLENYTFKEINNSWIAQKER